jgi:hypothetical protein
MVLLIAPPTNVIDDQIGNYVRCDGKEYVHTQEKHHTHDRYTSFHMVFTTRKESVTCLLYHTFRQYERICLKLSRKRRHFIQDQR